MDRRVLEFIGDLRRAEIRISPSEALDALAASAEIGLTDRDLFKAALASTLVKESRDLPTFERLFNLYFLDLQALGAGLAKALGPEDPRIRELLDRLMAEEGIEHSTALFVVTRAQLGALGLRALTVAAEGRPQEGQERGGDRPDGDEAGDQAVAQQSADRVLASGVQAVIGAAASGMSLAIIDKITMSAFEGTPLDGRVAPTAVIVNVGSVPELQQLLNPGQTVLSMNTNQKTISVCGLLSRNSRERARI